MTIALPRLMIEDRSCGFPRLGNGAFGESKERRRYFNKLPHSSFRKADANFEDRLVPTSGTDPVPK